MGFTADLQRLKAAFAAGLVGAFVYILASFVCFDLKRRCSVLSPVLMLVVACRSLRFPLLLRCASVFPFLFCAKQPWISAMRRIGAVGAVAPVMAGVEGRRRLRRGGAVDAAVGELAWMKGEIAPAGSTVDLWQCFADFDASSSALPLDL